MTYILLSILGSVEYAMGSQVILFRAVMIIRIVLARILIVRSLQPIREYQSFLSFRFEEIRRVYVSVDDRDSCATSVIFHKPFY